MNQHQNNLHRRVRSFLWIFGTLATLALGMNAWAANDLDTPTALKADNGNGNGNDDNNGKDGAVTFNTKWLGHNDLQGRVTYQTTVHTNPNGRVIAFPGHF